MLEKIGLPAKPSLRGNNWVVDASHCQGCSSQFTFINRKHHCRRCGGIFCGSCTQHRMYLRGQGDSPVRICEPCKRLEEASRFEKYGHKTRAGRGSSRVTSQPEDESLNQILGNDGKESGQETNNNVGSSMQRRTSGASCSNRQEEYNQEEVGSLSVEESNHSQNDSGSTTPEELRQQALDEKKKYKQLKGEGKQTEALRAFKKGKELERQADALEISLRKKRRKVVLSDNVTESQIKDDRSESRRSSRITTPVGREKDDLSAELKELGWSDMDLRDENKTQANLTLEGELSSLLGEISGKNKKDKGNSAIDKTQVLAHKRKALQLKREGKLAEAKEELKKSKVLEKQLEEQEFLAEAEESDDELSTLIRSMDDDKDDFSVQYKQADDFNFESLISVADDDHIVDSNFEVTDEDLEDPEIAAALNSLGWTQDDTSPPRTSATQVASVDKEAILAEITSLKREALTHKRAGNIAEAMAQLNKAKLLERDLENIESHEGNAVRPPTTVHKQSIDSSSKPLMVGDGNISTMEHIDSKASKKSISMIRKELLALKRKSLALRREGRLDEAEEELKRGRILEQQLEEMENGSPVETVPETVGSKNPHLGEHANVSRSPSFTDEEGDNVTDQDMYDPTYLSILKNLGWNEDDNEVANSSSEHYKQTDSMQVSESSAAHPPADLLVGGSRRSKAEIQRELLGVKRKALALRRQGDTDGAEEMLIKAKTLEGQMVEMEAPKKEVQSDFRRHKENIVVPPLNIVEEEDDGEDVTENDMQDPALLSVLQTLGWKDEEQSGDPSLPESATKLFVAPPRSKGEIQRELLDLKRKAFAFRRKGETEEAEEVLKMAKVLEAQLEELDGPKRLQPHGYSKEEKPGIFGLLINSDKQGSLKDAMEGERSTQAEMVRTDKVVKLPVGSGSMRSHAVNPLLKDTDFIGHPTSQSVKENQSSGVSGETSYPDNRRVVEGASQTSPLVQSGNFVDLLSGDDWRSCPGSTEGHDSVGSFSATPPIQLGSSREDLTKQEYVVVQKREDMVVKQDAREAILVQGSSSQKNESSIRQDILVFKRRALALKREGKLAEAREELRQAKVLEKHLEEDSPQLKTSSSDVSDSAYNIPPADQKRLEKENPQSKTSSSDVSVSVPPAGQKHHGSPSSDPKPMSSRDRFKLQQKSLGHKRQALKLRREGRVEEAEAEFELAKALETQLEESAAHDSKAVEPVDDVAIEGFLDPQLLAALKSVGIEDASVSSSQGPGRPEHPKPIIGKSDGGTQDENNLEEQIKAEKVKALHLKRAGKQAEALDALRRAKMLEKKLSSLAPK